MASCDDRAQRDGWDVTLVPGLQAGVSDQKRNRMNTTHCRGCRILSGKPAVEKLLRHGLMSNPPRRV